MGEAISFWLDEVLVNRRPSTKRGYRFFLTRFNEFLGETADAMIARRKRDLQSESPRVKKRYENYLKKFDAHLVEENASIGTRRHVWAAIRSFFRAFDLDLRFTRADAPQGESIENRAATKAEIRLLAQLTDTRGRAVVYTLKDTGIRVSDLARLQVGDVDLVAEYPILKLRTQKRGIVAVTVLGSEAQAAIREYLTSREYGTDVVPPEAITKRSPLIRQNSVEVKAMTPAALTVLLQRLRNTAKLRDISAHSLRRFFDTALEAAGVHPNWIDRLIGHKLVASRGSYSKPTDTQLRDAYIQAYDFLRVDEPVFDNERLTKLEEERQREHEERQRLAEKVLRVVDDTLAMRERLQTVEAENVALRQRVEQMAPAVALIQELLHDVEDDDTEHPLVKALTQRVIAVTEDQYKRARGFRDREEATK
jgi:integrase